MSRSKRGIPRAWRRGTGGPVYAGRSDELEAAAFAEAAERLAPRLGFCSWCGAIVNEDVGKLHEPDCGVSEARRKTA